MLKTKTKRVRISKSEIEQARQELIRKQEEATRKRESSSEPKYPKDFWRDSVYYDSYGWVWGLDEGLSSVCLGRSKDLASESDFAGKRKIIVATSPETVANRKHTQPFTPPSKSIVATFKKDPRFLRLLGRLIAKGLGIRAVQSELKARGYDIPLRTLGRWIKQRREARNDA